MRTGSSSSGGSDCAGRCRHRAYGCDLARSIERRVECGDSRNNRSILRRPNGRPLRKRSTNCSAGKTWDCISPIPGESSSFGAPNVGKSSLINALAGYERAIVSPTPGTTRDVVTVTTAIDGWPVQLSDTAGFRETQDELESAGIKLATTALSRADLAIFVHDAARLSENPATPRHHRTARPCIACAAIHVVNKIDLIPAAERLQLLQQFVNSRPEIGQPHAVSALNGEGIADLISAIARTLVPVSLPAGSAVPFTSEQVDGLAAAKAAVDQRDANSSKQLAACTADANAS